MSKRVHQKERRMLELDNGKIIPWPRCVNIGCNDYVTFSTGKKMKPGKLRVYCSRCHDAACGHTTLRKGVKPFKKCQCDKCGRKSKNTHYFDIDHINGKPYDNRKINLQELCLFCHKDKTIANGDHKKGRGHKIVRSIITKIT